MPIARFQWLAALIAAHPNRTVVGRTRLQKTVWLLQRTGFPTDYGYVTYFYGPYSEDLQSETKLLEVLDLATEEEHLSQDGTPYYVFRASEDAVFPEVEEFRPAIERLNSTDAVVLELAATYDAYRAIGCDHDEALHRLRRKKGSKCEEGREEKALELLAELELPAG
jgi:uncharacterized protein YwgA